MKVTAVLLFFSITGIMPVPAQVPIQELLKSAESGDAATEFQLGRAYL
jgi:hypothetical protein